MKVRCGWKGTERHGVMVTKGSSNDCVTEEDAEFYLVLKKILSVFVKLQFCLIDFTDLKSNSDKLFYY